ncbi:MAG: FHA domain-containing protein [Candidatus Melainabacteria bacterium]|nr:FHA domain-containing protein [Candidatus Melainabacteria bacterium]
MTLKEGESLIIGRSPTNEDGHVLRIPKNDISSNHAEIRNNEYGWLVKDLSSKNGTIVRGIKLEAEQICLLESGDLIQVAGHDLVAFTSIPLVKTKREPLTQENLRSMLQINITTVTAEIHGSGCAVVDGEPVTEQMISQRLELFMFLTEEMTQTFGHLDRLENNSIVMWWNNGIPFGAHERVKSPGEFLACQTALKLRDFAVAMAEKSDASSEISMEITITSGEAAAGNFGNVLYDGPDRLTFKVENNLSDIITDKATYDLVEDSFRFDPVEEPVVDGPAQKGGVYKLLRMKSKVKPHITNAK